MGRFNEYRRSIRAHIVKVLRWHIPIQFKSIRIVGLLSLLALVFLSCVFGAASMFFDFFPGNILRDAFIGYQALQERGNEVLDAHLNWSGDGVTCDKPDKTFDGFTLYTTTQGTKAVLIDMAGNVVHQWSLPFSKVWPRPEHLHNSPLSDEKIHWFRCHVYPNGDLLAIYQSSVDTPSGYGLAKLDKDSNLIWSYSDCVHHDFDVAEDGTIYTLTQRLRQDRPHGLESIPSPFLDDYLVQLSADGHELKRISLIEAFRATPFALTLFSDDGTPSAGPNAGKAVTYQRPSAGAFSAPVNYDFLHPNSVKVLSSTLAPKFPLFKAGQVLLSFRSINTIAVLDMRKQTLVWAVQGIWQKQHDPTFLANGHLLIYDNVGSQHGTRILEYDPNNHGYPWSYSYEDSEAFTALVRGMKQQLPNGDILIVDPKAGRIFEVTRGRERVWEFNCSVDDSPVELGMSNLALTGVHRYAPGQLSFLKGSMHARP
jgi:hypothetical protein